MNQEVLKQKQAQVSEITDLMKKSQAVVVCEYRGLTVKEVSSLRKDLREKGACAFVYKNSLVERACDALNESGLDEYLSGPNMFVFFEDYSNGSLKGLSKFAKRNEDFKIKAGIIEGKVCDEETVKEVAGLPNKLGLVSMFLSVLQAPMRNLAYSLSQVAESK